MSPFNYKTPQLSTHRQTYSVGTYQISTMIEKNNPPLLSSTVNLLCYLSRVVRKPAFCTCENKDADQLRGNRKADQRLCFRYMDSTISLLSKSEISSLKPSCLVVQTGLCGPWLETMKTGFLTTRLILIMVSAISC